jgi:hypothetical protein
MEMTLMKETDTLLYPADKQLQAQNEQQPYSEDGVDLTLIRWMLSMTPAERLKVLQENVQSLARLINESSFT